MLCKNLLLKNLWLRRYGGGAAGIIVCAIILRVILVILGWPATNSDESMNDLAALHIEKLGEHPIFFYGQNYLGNFEGYIGALLFRIAGPSVQGMRLEMLALTAAFLICMYFITRNLYSKGFALIVLLFFFFGSQWTMQDQIMASGYPEVPLFAAALFLTACIVTLHYYRLSSWKRCLLYALWGLLAGVSLWIQLLIVPYVLISGLLILILCWKEFFTRAIWCILPALLLGAEPLIYYNLHAAPGADSLHTFLSLSHMGYSPNLGLVYHSKIVFLFTLPVATSFTPACSIRPEVSLWLAYPHPLQCIAIDGAWSMGYFLLLLAGFVFAAAALRKAYKLEASPERSQQIAQQLARLMLLVGLGLSLIALVQGNAVNIDPTNSWRYLICTWVSLPAVLWPLWTAENWFKSRRARESVCALKWAAFTLLCLVLIHSTLLVFQQGVPAAQTSRQQITTLEQTLEHLHITRFYSTYWTCGRVIFDTQERLICGATDDVNNHISHGYDRYTFYRTIVEQDPQPGFVFPDGAAQIITLNRLLAQSHVRYERFEVPGYVIYKMYGQIPSLFEKP